MAPFQGEFFPENLRAAGTEATQLLGLLGEEPADLAARLSAVPTPRWVKQFTDVYETYDGVADEPGTEQGALLPSLMRVVDPLVRDARTRLLEQLRSDPANEQIQGLIEALCTGIPLQQLDMTLGPTMILEINVAREKGLLTNGTSQERFASFVEQLADPGYQMKFWNRYPVLARRVTEVLEQWIETRLRFAHHLQEGLRDIDHVLFVGENDDYGSVMEERVISEITFGHGDLHNGGQSVARVEFTDGDAVIYKPRSLGVDTVYAELLAQLGRDVGLHLDTPRVVDRGDHGWVEVVRPTRCASRSEAADFYQRLGVQLALFYVLNGTDLHIENLIAAGAHPVFIDLEALFHPASGSAPVWEAASNPASADPASEALYSSVLSTGLLPGKSLIGQEGSGPTRTTDLSGINGSEGQPWLVPVLVPENQGTDRVRLVSREVEVPGAENRPRAADGSLIDPGEFVDDVLTGFSLGYSWLREHRNELLGPTGLITQFADKPVRYLHRATHVYGKVLTESFHPVFVRDALDREQSVARLCDGWQGAPHRDEIIRSEMDAILNGDIPFFQALPGGRDLILGNGRRIPDFLAQAPLDQARQRLLTLDPDDLARQEWIIRASFADLCPAVPLTRLPQAVPAVPAEQTAEEAISTAEAIGDRLMQLAFVGTATDTGNVGWLGTHTVAEGVSDIEPIGVDLYSGLSGIGLFFRHLGRVSGQQRFSDFADRVSAEVVRRISSRRQAESPSAQDLIELGAFGPELSALYLLTHERHLLSAARSLAYESVRDVVLAGLDVAIERDEQLDVFGGSAGCVLVLLAAFTVDDDPRLLAMARRAADHLLSRAVTMASGTAWRNTSVISAQPITGLAHGTSGIFMALSRLADLVGDERYAVAAAQALAYEAATYDADAGNWPDLRDGAAERFRSAWCHGAAGIGLSRFELMAQGATHKEELGDSAVQDVLTALRATSSNRGNHSLCHGDLGNLELHLLAEQHGLVERGTARDGLRRIFDGVAGHGWRSGSPDGVEVPGLFTGLAGIGYGLLRVAAPEVVPSILLLHAPTQAGDPKCSETSQ
ncbi:type 2 lanthipeptide synthetase LanM family protein [Streptomyces violascens]|uniref:type 2 lanthipeptide synthetase LanM family protein n=1 Tax=Streptomyces violascens TaxID=67381 RepID=UPI003648571B